jgi:hypothetical protein
MEGNDMGMLDKTRKDAMKAQKEFKARLDDFYSKADSLKPDTADQADYDKLIEAVSEATAKNESIAAFETRVKGLGGEAMKLAKSLGLIAVA